MNSEHQKEQLEALQRDFEHLWCDQEQANMMKPFKSQLQLWTARQLMWRAFTFGKIKYLKKL